MYYILNGHTPVLCEDILEWAEWYKKSFKTNERIVEQTSLAPHVEVSTIFLGLDMNFFGEEPLIFETMIFGGARDQEIAGRYSTWEQAQVGHQKIVDEFKQRCAHCGILRHADEPKCTSCGAPF